MIAATKYDEGLSPLDFIRNRIKSEVKKAGFTYESFARLFNKTEGWFGHIMTGRTGLSIEVLLEIAKKLNISPSSLLPESLGEETPKNFEEYIKSIMMDVFEKEIIPRIKKELKNNK